jgi:hypothetical protein
VVPREHLVVHVLRRGRRVNAQTRTGKGFQLRRHSVVQRVKNRLTPSSVVPRKGRRSQPTGSRTGEGEKQRNAHYDFSDEGEW